MENKKGKNRKSIRAFFNKDLFLAGGSIVLLIVVFLLQLFLVLRVYESNKDLLRRELNLAVEEIYKIDLNRRLKDGNSGKDPDIRYYGSRKPAEVTDTSKVLIVDPGKHKGPQGHIELLNAVMEEYANLREPIRLQVLDSVAAECFKKRGISSSFYSEIVDAKSNKVLQTSLKPGMHYSQTVSSIDIPVNAAETRELRIILIDPYAVFNQQMTILVILPLSTVSIQTFSSTIMTEPLLITSGLPLVFEPFPLLMDEPRRKIMSFPIAGQWIASFHWSAKVPDTALIADLISPIFIFFLSYLSNSRIRF